MVKAGYKQTEVGVIPEDWEVARADKYISKLEAGVSVNSVADGKTAGLHKVLKTSCASAGKFDPEEAKEILPKDLRRAKLNPQINTIIVSRMNTPDLVGECGYVTDTHPELFLPDRLWMTHHRNDVPHSAKWLAECLAYPPVSGRIKSVATGTSGSMKNLSKEAFLSSLLPAPTNPEEQKAIAEALSDVDGLIVGLEALIAKKRNLKTATMQQLLTGKTRLPGFGEGIGMKQTELGEIPEDWETFKFGEHFNIFAGGDVPKHSVSQTRSESHPHPIFANAIQHEGLYGFTSEKRTEGDAVTITARGYLGHAEYRNAPFFPIVRLLVLEPLGRLEAEFATYAINEGVEFAIESTGVPQLTAPQVKNYSLAAPKELNEQKAITKALAGFDVLIDALDLQLEKTKALKQGMMQELLTGRTRLI